MNNKGFAVTSMVYSAVILLALVMFTILAIVQNEYTNQKEFVEDINKTLTQCIGKGGC